MFKVKIESEIQKVKKNNVEKGDQLLQQTNQLLLQQSNDETEVIRNIGINKSLVNSTNERTSNHLERKELERKTGDNVFTIDEIKTMFTNKRIPDNVHLPIEFVDKPVLNIQTWPQYIANNALNIPELRVLDFRWLSANFNTFNYDPYAFEFINSKLSLF